MNFLNYWRTQWVLKKKWLLNKWPVFKASEFQPFVILCDPRTGSTWLHTLLNSSTEIQSYGEVLSERDMSEGLQSIIWKPHTRSIKAVGGKLFYEQLLHPEFAHILTEMVSNQSIKVIDLTRENELKMYVSLKIAEDTHEWSANTGAVKNKRKIMFDEPEFEKFRQLIKQNRQEILTHLRNHEVCSLTYEQLHNNTQKELIRIQKFLGVRPQRLFSLLKKQNTESIYELVENQDDIQEYVF